MPTPGRLARPIPYALAFFAGLCVMTLELVASRLVARHVGASLQVWTSVIGVVLGGICLGNVLGGRLADRIDPRRAVGPLFAIGGALTLACPWVNEVVGRLPGLDAVPWSVRSLLVVALDFLPAATILGMISPVVATMAVDRAAKAGSALGDVSFWGAAGSIAGTFLAGFILIARAPTSAIVSLVAAALLLPAALLSIGRVGSIFALIGAIGLGLAELSSDRPGAAGPLIGIGPGVAGILEIAGVVGAIVAGLVGLSRLRTGRRDEVPDASESASEPVERSTGLADLALLAFLVSLSFMALEMVAGRMVTHHLGSSLYGWTSVIGILLGGLSLGNLIGGKVADEANVEKKASWLFLIASVLVLSVIFLETPPRFLGEELAERGSLLTYAMGMDGVPWSLRVLSVVAAVFLLPSVALGTVGPVLAKLAVDRLRRSGKTGTAIGAVYAWGMVGSISGTFLAGFVLIDVLGAKGVILAVATSLAIAATALGRIGHAAWAGVPLGLCAIAFLPLPVLTRQAVGWGVRNPPGDPNVANGVAHLDESDYYVIKVDSELVPPPTPPGSAEDADSADPAVRRTLVLDNLIHGYYVLGYPEHIEYDYEFIYAQVARRVAEAKAERLGIDDPSDVPLRVLFLGGGSYTFPRYLQHVYPKTECDVAEIDPAVTRANIEAMGLPEDTTILTHWGDARRFVTRMPAEPTYDLVFGDAFNDFSVPWHLTTVEFNDRLEGLLEPGGAYMINIIDVYRADDIAAERAVEEAQIGAIAAVLKRAGNEPEDAGALARGLRTAWAEEGLGIRPDRIGPVVKHLMDATSARHASAILDRIDGPIRNLEGRFQGPTDTLAEVALRTLRLARRQREESAATEAIARELDRRKAAFAEEALREAGAGGDAPAVAERIALFWTGGTPSVVGLIRGWVDDDEVEPIASRIAGEFASLEADLAETPVLLVRKLIPSPAAGDVEAAPEPNLRTAGAIADRLRALGVRRGAGDYGAAIAEAIRSSSIRGDLDQLATSTALAAEAFGTDGALVARVSAEAVARARGMGAFLGAWLNTAEATFGSLAVFGTDDVPGNGYRETFVVVASAESMDLEGLGRREGDPVFLQDDEPFNPDPYDAEDREALRIRSRGIVLTDDYAPVENLLAPVAATRVDE